jgi:predicted nucleic acid-binding Zn ribbon protein
MVCIQCGIEFDQSNSTGPKPRYCSFACRHRYRYEKRVNQRKPMFCFVCGKQLARFGQFKRKTCSAKCRIALKQAMTQAKRFSVVKSCVVCGKSFIGSDARATCERKCRIELKRSTERMKTGKKACLNCGA